MTMHLEGPWLSTTGKKKGPKKWASAEAKRKAEQLDTSWKEMLKRHGVEQEKKRQRRAMTADVWNPAPTVFRRETPVINSLPFTGGPCVKPPEKVYTGTKIKGIGTMHKSNAVPIFSDEEAVAIANMRR
jgi:hypothetical protein